MPTSAPLHHTLAANLHPLPHLMYMAHACAMHSPAGFTLLELSKGQRDLLMPLEKDRREVRSTSLRTPSEQGLCRFQAASTETKKPNNEEGLLNLPLKANKIDIRGA